MPDHTRVQRVAHRGNAWGRRENTVAAFESAAAIGCDWLEVDVRTTRDSRVVVVHDATLARLWRHPAAVSDLDLHEVRSLGLTGTRIPLLEEVLDVAIATGTRVLIDVTNQRDGLNALALVRSYAPARELTVAYCGATDAMLAIREVAPDAALQYGHPGGLLADDVLARLRPYAVNADWTLYDVPLVRAIHARGLEAWAWTINDADTMQRLIAMGIDAITTDRVRMLGDIVARHRRGLGEADRAQPAAHHVDVDRSLEVARELAEWAVLYTREAPLGDITTKKHAADVVTEVDTAVERHVRTVVAAELPGHLVVGEEEGGESQPGVPTWYLDPVDGTTNLANHLPWTSFSFAMAVDRTPLVAAVAHPWQDEVLLAARGRGATRRGYPLRLTTTRLGVILTELAAHQPWPGMLELLDRAAAAHVTMRIMGSGTLTLSGVAAGWGQAAVIHSFSPIDHLAALLLVHEAGGVVRDETGRDTLFPDLGVGVMVAAPAVADQAYALWRG
jgi:fructose-1,6-bisphosphatase/inositol monophosphatase family enzyme/glycerophosphoryl diester phosphodiesterase